MKTATPRDLRPVGGLSQVREWIARGYPVVFSIAPAYAGLVGPDGIRDWVGRLNEAGALWVEETAVALGPVVEMRMRAALSGEGWLTSCPRVARLLRSGGSEAARNSVPTPMALHARQIRRRGPAGVRVAFIGPCRYKRLEAMEDPEGPDAIVTFRELLECVPLSGLVPNAGHFAVSAAPEARLAPLVGGVSGLNHVQRFIHARAPVGTVELLGCRGGCLAGPEGATPEEWTRRIERLMKFAALSEASSFFHH